MAYTLEHAAFVASRLEKLATQNVHQLRGQFANLDFWLGEAEHAIRILDDYPKRFTQMRDAQLGWVYAHGTLVSGYCPRRDRMPELPDTAAFELAPDWVCEVLSPSTAATDRAEKMPIYAREGVLHLWLVDPLARTLEACRLENDRWSLLGTWRDDARVRVEPFAELDLELAGLWAR